MDGSSATRKLGLLVVGVTSPLHSKPLSGWVNECNRLIATVEFRIAVIRKFNDIHHSHVGFGDSAPSFMEFGRVDRLSSRS